MTPSPEDHKDTATNPADAQPHVADNFAETLQLFWFQYRTIILWCAGAILVSIVGKGGWDMYVETRETAIGREYAAAGDATDKLKQFAVAHDGHILAGAALLRVADEAYTSGKYAEAQASYEKAQTFLVGFPAKGRARLGAALSQVLGGKNAADGESSLKAIIADSTEFKGVRAEAAYHLAMIKVEAGNNEEAVKIIDQLVQIDMVSGWARRAMMLRPSIAANLPVSAQTAPKADEPVKLNLPTGSK